MENINPTRNPITTYLGIGFVLISMLIYVAPMFFPVPASYTEKWYVPLVPAVFGVILILSPDKIVTGATSYFKQKVTVTTTETTESKPEVKQ